jgi:hypothetical protein
LHLPELAAVGMLGFVRRSWRRRGAHAQHG